MPKPDDTGVLLYSKLSIQGPLNDSLLKIKQEDIGRLKQVLTACVDATSLSTYINLLEICQNSDSNPNADIFSWLIAAWSLDSAIVQKQFQNYTELTI